MAAIYDSGIYGTDVYGPLGSSPGIDTVEPGYLSLRINFLTRMTNDTALLDASNYTVTPNESGAVDTDVVGVTPEPDVTYPQYVDLEMLDLTHGKEYQLVITPNELLDHTSTYLVVDNTALYDGVSELPLIQNMTSTSSNEIIVVFTKPMSPNDDLTDPARYSFDNGLRVLSVNILGEGIVRLTTSDQVPSTLYTLTVS